MSRVVWLVLKNGESVIAGCGKLDREAFDSLMAEPHRWMTLKGEETVRFIRGDEIRDFRLFDAEIQIEASSSIRHSIAV